MTDPDELDTELRRLFGDERLAVGADEDAPARIVAGARRIRRRRAAVTATSGALTVAALVTAGLFFGPLRATHTNTAAPVEQPTLSSNGTSAPASSIPLNPPPGSSPTSEPPASSPESASPPQSSTSRTAQTKPTTPTSSRSQTPPPAVSGPVLGPSGYGKLTLGMSFTDAKNSGLLANADTPPNGCTNYKLAEGSSGVSSVTISDTGGVVGFAATGAHTPERIRVGSPKDDLEAAYPNLSKSGNGYTAAAGSGASYVFSVDSNQNRVTAVSLVAANSC
ncbi:hypothetical protein [Amycolatopsis pithecellobii]|uniref:Uncharacterized protein n=1 Tax=Amycolatopsis pithecellobii TaxID=664692 RepID=A0A6N7Z695_9PSEU|nr:hypothetical protein [Amycolatopsis pithecellobii]MTD56391.1 hypothetical protein [Amycolatopsis pithecellobii]